MTHPRLSSIHLDDAQREITESKKWIEQRIHAPCQMFCYPFGDENRQVHALVREAGFIGARNTQQLQWGVTDPFQMPTTLQIYPYPLRRRFVRRQDLLDPFSRLRMLYPSLKPLHLPLWAYCSWLGLAKALFLYGLQARKSIFHLWGHSWEVEKYGMWSSLEQFLIFVRSYNNVQHVTNTALINH
jgi:peptidoglycan/xylan/chitin deacetylase (PgdA/CDA1 family)